MRLGVMGGTFDPIHHGHLVAASEVQAQFDLDEVVFVPTGRPWQKSGRVVAPAEHRYLMTVIATASNPRFTVSRVDIDRDGPTYTIDTLRDLRVQRPVSLRRCPPRPSPPPTAASGYGRASPSGTSFPTAWCSTSLSTICMPRAPRPPRNPRTPDDRH